MINRILDWCAANRFLVFTATAALTIWGIWAMVHSPLDAVPDISDVQVIVSTEWAGRSPDLIEDQITYPIVSSLISTPHVKAVRGFTDFGVSYVYVIFDDRTDMYWARSRVVEYLQGIRGQLPEGTNPVIGPDATGARDGCLSTRSWTRRGSIRSPISAASRIGTCAIGLALFLAWLRSPAWADS